jgi:hypothetical protein
MKKNNLFGISKLKKTFRVTLSDNILYGPVRKQSLDRLENLKKERGLAILSAEPIPTSFEK